MATNSEDIKVQIGDKVRVKSGEFKGQRGIVIAMHNEQIEIELIVGNATQLLDESELTNYSLAARRAWQKMPKKAGRPRSFKRKKMISIRLDEELWARLGKAVENGFVNSREEAVNNWLRERLDAVTDRADDEFS